MPETANFNDLWQLRVRGRIEQQETINVLNFRYVSALPDPDVVTHLIKALMQCYLLHLIPVLTSGWELQDIAAKRMGPTLGNEVIVTPDSASIGAGNAEALPSYCSVVFSIRTVLGGKSGRGRLYLPGIPENQTEGSIISSDLPLWLGLVAFAACVVEKFHFEEPIPPGGITTFPNIWKMGVYSRKLGSPKAPYTLAGFHEMVSMVPNKELGTTRSRKIGKGR